MPPSPSPAKKPARSEHSNRDSLIPRFDLQPPNSESSPKPTHRVLSSSDFCSASKAGEEAGELSFASFEDPLDPGNLSIGHSEVSLLNVSNMDLEAELQQVLNPPQPDNKDDVPRLSDLIPRNTSFTTSTPPPHTPPLSFATSASSAISAEEQVLPRERGPLPTIPSLSRTSPAPAPAPSGKLASRPHSPSGVSLQRSSGSPTGLNLRRRSESPFNLSARLTDSPALRSASPSVRAGSPLREMASAQDLQGDRMPRTRISRGDVQMRLLRKRSLESPIGSPAPGSPVPPAEPSAVGNVDERTPDEQPSMATGCLRQWTR
ncbi:hypothetical protein JVU11DRAFT_7338 [Chiua virens]|nr:hypothetical protein JVU11DRAFT_7338 [Chiua virens]